MDIRQYKNLRLRSSKSHLERLHEQNTRTLLRETPNGSNYIISSNGRVIKKSTTRQPGQPGSPRGGTSFHSSQDIDNDNESY
jgi:hypothetical protein